MPSRVHSGCIFQACYLQAQFEIPALRSIETEGVFVIQGGVRSGRCFCGRHQLPHRWSRGHCVGGHGVPRAVLPERFVPRVRRRWVRAQADGRRSQCQCGAQGRSADCVQELQRPRQDQPNRQGEWGHPEEEEKVLIVFRSCLAFKGAAADVLCFDLDTSTQLGQWNRAIHHSWRHLFQNHSISK